MRKYSRFVFKKWKKKLTLYKSLKLNYNGTGEYSYEESQNGGRYKKSIRMGNQTCLLLIRDESGPPTKEVCLFWAAILMFLYITYNLIYRFYNIN